jgi:uncharacterized protein
MPLLIRKTVASGSPLFTAWSPEAAVGALPGRALRVIGTLEHRTGSRRPPPPPVGEGTAMSDDTTTRLGDEKFVSLTTFKRNGDVVASPMWIARDGEQLVAWTPADAWKVKRIRRDPRVTLAPCGRTGKVRAEQPTLPGTAEVITESNEVARVEALIKQKYGVEFRVVTFVETIAARGRQPRVVLRITSTGPA